MNTVPRNANTPAKATPRALVFIAAVSIVLLLCTRAAAQIQPAKGKTDSRIRTALYSPSEVYRLHGYVGFQIDLQFEAGEAFTGLGAGDIEGLSFVAQDNHLFLKPKVDKFRTNVTVLTNRRHYQFDYSASAQPPETGGKNVIYALKFTYAPPPGSSGPTNAERIAARFGEVAAARPLNIDYWYCGTPSVRPVAASDDGVHTRLKFAARSELPAIFVSNEDGSESLLNFSMDAGDVIVHRVARKFIVRRGKLTGCIVNKGFAGGGERLKSGTVAAGVERTTQGGRP